MGIAAQLREAKGASGEESNEAPAPFEVVDPVLEKALLALTDGEEAKAQQLVNEAKKLLKTKFNYDDSGASRYLQAWFRKQWE